MNDNVITLKLTPLPMMYNLVNFIIFGLIITFIINWSCGIIAAGICFLVAFRDRNNIKDFIIDPDKDILSFSSFYQYSIWKSIVCVIYPLFRMNATMTIKISDLYKVSCTNSKRVNIVELYNNDGGIMLLRFSSAEDAGKLITGLQEIKPDIYKDKFPSDTYSHSRQAAALIIIFCILCFNNTTSPFRYLIEKIQYKIHTPALKFRLQQQWKNCSWQLDNITDLVKAKDHYLLSATLKNAQNKKREILLKMNNFYDNFYGDDYKLLNLEETCKKGIYEKVLQKNKKNWQIDDVKIIHMQNNEYFGIVIVSNKTKKLTLYLNITDNNDSISWQFAKLNFSPLFL